MTISTDLDAVLIGVTRKQAGTLLIFGDTWVVFMRMDTGLCKRFTFAELGFGDD